MHRKSLLLLIKYAALESPLADARSFNIDNFYINREFDWSN